MGVTDDPTQDANKTLIDSSTAMLTAIPDTEDYLSLCRYTNHDDPMCVNMTLFMPKSPLTNLIVKLDLYLVPVIIVVGFLGNTMSFIVFVATELRTLSSSVYLAALAIADTGFLLCVFIMWSHNINWNLHHQPGWCQLFVYLTYFFSFLSVWYVVSFTVERFIAVCFPFKRSTMCTVRRARIVVIVMPVMSSIMYNYALWTTESVKIGGIQFCQPKNNLFALVQIVNNLDTVITLIIPMLVIIILNIRISQKMISFHRDMRKMLRNRTHTARDPFMGGASRQVTKMLLVVSTVFLVLNFPSHAIRVHHFLVGFSQSYIPNQTYIDCQTLFQYIYYLNFATNFFLYSVAGKNFRQALKHLLRRRKIKPLRSLRSRFRSSQTGTLRSTRSSNRKSRETQLEFEMETCYVKWMAGPYGELY